jgi:hypothetical protein
VLCGGPAGPTPWLWLLFFHLPAADLGNLHLALGGSARSRRSRTDSESSPGPPAIRAGSSSTTSCRSSTPATLTRQVQLGPRARRGARQLLLIYPVAHSPVGSPQLAREPELMESANSAGSSVGRRRILQGFVRTFLGRLRAKCSARMRLTSSSPLPIRPRISRCIYVNSFLPRRITEGESKNQAGRRLQERLWSRRFDQLAP